MDKIEAIEKRIKELEEEVARLRLQPPQQIHYHYPPQQVWPHYAPLPAYPTPSWPTYPGPTCTYGANG